MPEKQLLNSTSTGLFVFFSVCFNKHVLHIALMLTMCTDMSIRRLQQLSEIPTSG